MYDEDVVEPIPCPDAFGIGGELASYSQAALLLAVGIALKPGSALLLADLVESQPFPLPELQPLVERVPEEYFASVLERVERESNDIPADELRRTAADNLYGNPREHGNGDGVLRLLAASLVGADELVRVAAAVSTLDLVDASTAAFRTLLSSAARSPSALVRAIAISALVRVEDRLPGWQGLVWRLYRRAWQIPARARARRARSLPNARSADADTCIVHGTLFSRVGGRIEEWWKPGTGDFHEYLRKGPRPNVYSGRDYYRWSGGWNDLARAEAALDLSSWIGGHKVSELDIFAHSHGCNVAMLASHQVKARTLILLSCPVHWSTYQPDFSNVGKVVSIRVKWDLAIMADRGGQRFRDPRIQEHVLPVWYGRHDSSRRSSTWRNRDLAAYVRADDAAATAAPVSDRRSVPPTPTFDYLVSVKGPLDVATELVSAMRAVGEVRDATFKPAVFKNSRPRPEYSIHVVACESLTESRIHQLANQVNAEIVSFRPAPWASGSNTMAT